MRRVKVYRNGPGAHGKVTRWKRARIHGLTLVWCGPLFITIS